MRPLGRALVFLVVAFAGGRAAAEDYGAFGSFAVGLGKFTTPNPDHLGRDPMALRLWYPAAGPAPDPVAPPPPVLDALPATAEGPFPLLVLIHGLSAAAIDYSAWGKQLASHGFVVIAADHLDYDAPGAFDSTTPEADRLPTLLLHDRPADIIREIAFADSLTALGGTLAGLIDTSNIGVVGHSTGGTTALQAGGGRIDLKALDAWCSDKREVPSAAETCQFVGHEASIAADYGVADPFAAPLPPLWDNRVRALVLAAPGGELHAFGDVGIAAITAPALVIVSADDEYVDPAYNSLWAYDHLSSRDKSLALYSEGGHGMFFVVGRSLKTADGRRSVELVGLVNAFFADVLKHDPAAHAALLRGAVSFPGLTYTTTLR